MKTINDNILNEDFFDELASEEIIDDEAEFEGESEAAGYDFIIKITITKIAPKYRKTQPEFLDLVKKVTKRLKYIFNCNHFIDNYGNFKYSILSSKINSSYSNYTRRRLGFNNPEDGPEEFVYNDLIFYNPVEMIKNPNNVKLYSQYTITIPINFSKNPKLELEFFNVYKTLSIVLSKLYNAGRNCAIITNISLKNLRTNKICGMPERYLEDIINRKNSNSTKNILQKFHKTIFNNKNYKNVDDLLSAQKYSNGCLDIVSRLGLKTNNVYIDEDTESLRIEIPKDIKAKSWDGSLKRGIEDSKKYVDIQIDGQLTLNVWCRDDLDYIIDNLYPNVNSLILNIKTHDKNRLDKIDLSMLFINNLKVVYPLPSDWTRRHNPTEVKNWYKAEVILNPGKKPDTFKITER